MSTQKLPTVDIVIIGRNEGPSLKIALEAAQIALDEYNLLSGHHSRIIYVDGHSSDDSVSLAKKHGASPSLVDGPPTAAAGRAHGANISDAEYIFFLDGDMEIYGGWLQSAALFLADNSQNAAVVGTLDWETICDGKVVYSTENYRGITASDKRIYNTVGGAIFMRRKDLLDAGNWDSNLPVCEEFDLYLRITALGKNIVSLNTPMATHRDRKSVSASSFLNRNIFSRKLFIPGQVIFRAPRSPRVSWVILATYWIHLAHILLVTGLIIGLCLLFRNNTQPGLFLALSAASAIILLHLKYKKWNVKRAAISIIMMNFYSTALLVGVLGISSLWSKSDRS